MAPPPFEVLCETIGSLFPQSGPVHPGPDPITAEPGAYLVLIGLSAPLCLHIRKLEFVLPAGAYVYAGSARGPGGLRARLGRHLSAVGRPHWHIDQMTARAETLTGLAFPGENECALCMRLLESGRFAVPAPGFGSSDCRRCPAHLLQFVS